MPKIERCIQSQCLSFQQTLQVDDDTLSSSAYKYIFVEEGKPIPEGEIFKVVRVARNVSTADMDAGAKGVELELQENPLQHVDSPDGLEVEMLDEDEELSKDVGVPGVTV